MIDALYPSFRAKDNRAALGAWHSILADYPADLMAQALKRYAATETSGFAPTPGQLIEQIRQAHDVESETGMEAWQMVLKAIRRSTYYAEEEFQKLPVPVQRCVGSPAVLRQWAMADVDTLGVMQANFLRTYNAKAAQMRTESALTPGIKNLLKSTGGALMIERGEDGKETQTTFTG